MALSTSTAATLKFKMGLEDFLQTWGQKSWKDLGLLEPEPSTSSSSSSFPQPKAKVQKTSVTAGLDAKTKSKTAAIASPTCPGFPAPATPPEALEEHRLRRQEGAHAAGPAPAKEEALAKEVPKKEEPKSEEQSDSSSSGFDESEESEGAVEPQAKPKFSKRQMEFNFFGYKRRGGGRKKRQDKQNKEQRLARLARQSKYKGKKVAFASLLSSSLR